MKARRLSLAAWPRSASQVWPATADQFTAKPNAIARYVIVTRIMVSLLFDLGTLVPQTLFVPAICKIICGLPTIKPK
jgi:hypothetical protein